MMIVNVILCLICWKCLIPSRVEIKFLLHVPFLLLQLDQAVSSLSLIGTNSSIAELSIHPWTF